MTVDKPSRTWVSAPANSKKGRNSGRGITATAVLLTTSTSANRSLHFDFASRRFVNCGAAADDTGAASSPTNPAPVPFERAAHCRRIASFGGATTARTHGTYHMRVIGQTDARVTIDRRGYRF